MSRIYSQFFPLGNSSKFSKYLFGAIRYINADVTGYRNIPENETDKKIYFKDLVIALSVLTKGSVDERIKWAFNLYDLDKDGRINKEV